MYIIVYIHIYFLKLHEPFLEIYSRPPQILTYYLLNTYSSELLNWLDSSPQLRISICAKLSSLWSLIQQFIGSKPIGSWHWHPKTGKISNTHIPNSVGSVGFRLDWANKNNTVIFCWQNALSFEQSFTWARWLPWFTALNISFTNPKQMAAVKSYGIYVKRFLGYVVPTKNPGQCWVCFFSPYWVPVFVAEKIRSFDVDHDDKSSGWFHDWRPVIGK